MRGPIAVLRTEKGHYCRLNWVFESGRRIHEDEWVKFPLKREMRRGEASKVHIEFVGSF
jgi:hypothetical protein